jgi:hypothetical protein
LDRVSKLADSVLTQKTETTVKQTINTLQIILASILNREVLNVYRRNFARCRQDLNLFDIFMVVVAPSTGRLTLNLERSLGLCSSAIAPQ